MINKGVSGLHHAKKVAQLAKAQLGKRLLKGSGYELLIYLPKVLPKHRLSTPFRAIPGIISHLTPHGSKPPFRASIKRKFKDRRRQYTYLFFSTKTWCS